MEKLSLSMAIKKKCKVFVRVVEKLLPQKVFDFIYSLAFPFYKGVIRFFYLLLGARYVLAWDKPGIQMVKRIYANMPYTLVGIGGLTASYQIVKEVCEKNIPGDVVELGVARGGCAAIMASVLFDAQVGIHQKKLWLFDSYEGLPDPTEKDFNPEAGNGTGDHVRPLPKGSCLGTIDEVKYLLFDKRKFPRDRIEFAKGWFENTIPATRNKIGKIAVLRIDGDWYESTKCCLEGLYDKVVPGGFVIIDDFQSCYGCERATKEFVEKNRLEVDIQLDGRGGCYFQKG